MTNPAMLTKKDEKDLIALCQDLVKINSVNPPGNELVIAQFIKDYLEQSGVKAELVYHDDQRASVLAVIKGSGKADPVIFSAHIDTVPVGDQPWIAGPFSGEIIDGKLYGRGSSDMKGGLAAMMIAVRKLMEAKVQLKGDLVLAFSAGEENNFLGAYALAERDELKKAQVLLVSEPSSNQLALAEKGGFWLKVVTHGQTAHGSRPEQGRNAVMMMMQFLQEFMTLDIKSEPHPLLGQFTRSVNVISGGMKTNVVPDSCMVEVDMRTVGGQDHQQILKQIQELIKRLETDIPGFKAEASGLSVNTQPVVTDENHPAVVQFRQILERETRVDTTPIGMYYGTDAAVYVPLYGYPMIICGPGRAELAHQPNEFIDIDKLIEAARVYILAALEWLN